MRARGTAGIVCSAAVGSAGAVVAAGIAAGKESFDSVIAVVSVSSVVADDDGASSALVQLSPAASTNLAINGVFCR